MFILRSSKLNPNFNITLIVTVIDLNQIMLVQKMTVDHAKFYSNIVSATFVYCFSYRVRARRGTKNFLAC